MNPIKITSLNAEQAAVFPQLVELQCDSIEHNAKIGYLRLGTIPHYAVDPDSVFVAGSTIFYRLLN